MALNNHLNSARVALKVGIGLAAFLAGLDKFFNLLANWPTYLNPLATRLIPVSPETFMHVVGVVEMAVGLAVLTRWTRLGAYAAGLWLAAIAVSLVSMGAFFDIAVRDFVMALSAYTLARLAEAHAEASEVSEIIDPARTFARIAVLALAISLPFASTARAQETHALKMTAEQHAKAGSSAAFALRQDMRRLWSDHVFWTRDYMVAAVAGSPDQQAAATRLLKNQEDIGAAVATFYGKAAGDQLTALLKQHIMIAVDLIAAAKAHDTAKYQDADRKWQQNAVEIAGFLSKANPNWPNATLVDMMKTHLATTTQEVVARLNGKWDDDVNAFDAVYTHILHMADALSDGIIRQFPEKFQ